MGQSVSAPLKPDGTVRFSRGGCSSGRFGARVATAGVGPGQADAVPPPEP